MTAFRYGGTPTPSGYHYGRGGLGVLGSEVPSDGTDGASPIYAGLSLPTEDDNEFRIVVTTTPTLGELFVYEDTSFSFTGPDGVHVWTYAAYKDGILYGTGTITLVIGEGLAGSFAFDSFLLEGAFEGSLDTIDVVGRRIGPRVALRANGELLVLF